MAAGTAMAFSPGSMETVEDVRAHGAFVMGRRKTEEEW
jgi:urease beta subunit